MKEEFESLGLAFNEVFTFALALLVPVFLGMIFWAVVSYLKLIWEEKHKPRRQTLTYADIVRIMSLEISCLPFDHVLFGDYRTAIGHLENIADYYERNSNDGIIPKFIEKHIESSFFKDIQQERKTFEIRRDKDDIQPGDILVLREICSHGETGRVAYFRVKGVLRDAKEYGLRRGYCIISI